MCDVAFQNAYSDIMNEEIHRDLEIELDFESEKKTDNNENDDTVWTDYDSEEEEDDEETFIEPCNCHEIVAEPCFEVAKTFDPCAICFEDIKTVNMTVTRCGHVFHASCMFEAIVKNENCPLCRTQLINKELGDDEEEQEQENNDDAVEEEDEEEVRVSWTIDRRPNVYRNHYRYL